MTCTMMGARL